MIISNLRKRCALCIVLCVSIFLCGCSLSENEEEEKEATPISLEETAYNSEEMNPEELVELEEEILEIIDAADGTWSIYVKNLATDSSISINNKSMYAASLIKLFVMEKTWADFDQVVENDSLYTGSEEQSYDKVLETLENMIEISDNESYNELVRIQNKDRSFTEGCLDIQSYIDEMGYTDTGIYHTLSPSNTSSESVSDEENQTSVEDCGALLEAIYNGDCVSQEASCKMLQLLLAQERVGKIPAGLPEEADAANKTGETDTCQHDVAIVYGPSVDYILCVMSEDLTNSDDAVLTIQEISSTVYSYFNM